MTVSGPVLKMSCMNGTYEMAAMMPMPMISLKTRNRLVKMPTLNSDSRSVRQAKPLATWPATMAAWVMVIASRQYR